MPFSPKAKYRHIKQRPPERFEKGSQRTVPIANTAYSGKKYSRKGVKAIVGRLKKRYRKVNAYAIQTILVPKTLKI